MGKVVTASKAEICYNKQCKEKIYPGDSVWSHDTGTYWCWACHNKWNLGNGDDVTEEDPEENTTPSRSKVEITSFSFKKGTPPTPWEENVIYRMIDVRKVRNPWHVPGMRKLDGRHPDVQVFIGRCKKAQELLKTWTHMASNYNLVTSKIHVGCTGGKHRSVAFAELLAKALPLTCDVTVVHRDLKV